MKLKVKYFLLPLRPSHPSLSPSLSLSRPLSRPLSLSLSLLPSLSRILKEQKSKYSFNVLIYFWEYCFKLQQQNMMSSRCEEKRSEAQKRQIGVLVLGGMVKNELISFLDGLEKNGVVKIFLYKCFFVCFNSDF